MKTFTVLCVVLACFESTISVYYHVNVNEDIQRQPHNHIAQHYLSNLQAANVSKFPYHVIVVDSSKTKTNPYIKPRIVCQGALIDKNWIITSASCVWSNYGNLDPETTLAVMGINDLEKYHEVVITRKLSYPVYHPQFDTQTGRGYDVALWKLKTPIMDTGYERVIDLVDQPRLPTLSNCEYTTNIDHILYRNNAKLMILKPCEAFGVPDDIGNCVMMNNTLHENTKHFEPGCPLVCGNKLYAFRNVDGHFTTAFNSKPWVGLVINERQDYDSNKIPGHQAEISRDQVRNSRRNPVSSNEEKEEPYTSRNYNRSWESVADADQYTDSDKSNSHTLIRDLPKTIGTSSWFFPDIQGRWFQRAIGGGLMDHLFQWCSKIFTKRQHGIKMTFAKKEDDGEMDVIDEKQFLEAKKEYEAMEKKEEAKMKDESATLKFRFFSDIRGRRFRRAISGSDMDLMFQSWSKTVAKMDPKRQLGIKMAIAKIVYDAEIEEYEQKQYLEARKKYEAMDKEREAKKKAESEKTLNSTKEEQKREYLKKH